MEKSAEEIKNEERATNYGCLVTLAVPVTLLGSLAMLTSGDQEPRRALESELRIKTLEAIKSRVGDCNLLSDTLLESAIENEEVSLERGADFSVGSESPNYSYARSEDIVSAQFQNYDFSVSYSCNVANPEEPTQQATITQYNISKVLNFNTKDDLMAYPLTPERNVGEFIAGFED